MCVRNVKPHCIRGHWSRDIEKPEVIIAHTGSCNSGIPLIITRISYFIQTLRYTLNQSITINQCTHDSQYVRLHQIPGTPDTGPIGASGKSRDLREGGRVWNGVIVDSWVSAMSSVGPFLLLCGIDMDLSSISSIQSVYWGRDAGRRSDMIHG